MQMFSRDLFSLNDSFEMNIALNSRKKLNLHEKFFFYIVPLYSSLHAIHYITIIGLCNDNYFYNNHLFSI